jgi:hypothetical protein
MKLTKKQLKQIINEELGKVLSEVLPGAAGVKSKRQKRKFIDHTRQLIAEIENLQKEKATMKEIGVEFGRDWKYDKDNFSVWHDAHQTLKERLRTLLKGGQHFENFKFSPNPDYQFDSRPEHDIGSLDYSLPKVRELHQKVQGFLSRLATYVQKFARRQWRADSAPSSESRYENATTWSLLPDEDRDFIVDYLVHSQKTFTKPSLYKARNPGLTRHN